MERPSRGFCRFYQRTGACRYGAACKFLHEAPPTSRSSPSHSSPSPSPSPDIAPFSLDELRQTLRHQLTTDLALSRTISDALIVLRPRTTTGYKQDLRWKRFLLVDAADVNAKAVDTPTDVVVFSNAALHAMQNPSIAPQFLRAMGQKDGMGVEVLRRIVKMEYAVHAGHTRSVVSFQRGFVPLLLMLTTQRLTTSAMLHTEGATYIYSCVHDHLDVLVTKYMENICQIVNTGDLDDALLPHARFLATCEGTQFAPLCFTQLVLPFLQLLDIMANKFRTVIYREWFGETVERIEMLVCRWQGTVGETELDSELCFRLMHGAIQHLTSMAQSSSRSLHIGKALAASRKQKSDAENMGAVDSTEQQWKLMPVVPPGEQVLENGRQGPRHDNDHTAIVDVRILPTTEEVFAPYRPALPGNCAFLEGAHWLPPGPERWIDTHFRLFREDMCRLLRESLQDLAERFRHVMARDGNIQALECGRLKSDKVDFTLYKLDSLELAMYHTDKERQNGERRVHRGLCTDLSFYQSTLGLSLKQRDREQFWTRTGRLRHSSMVCLVWFHENKLDIVFCKVVVRELKDLVKDPAQITVQPFESADLKMLYQLQRPERQVYMVELNKLFFDSYEPVLKALQGVSPFEMPFVDYLAPGHQHDEDGFRAINQPVYCSQPGFQFDLEPCLLKGQRLIMDPTNDESRRESVDNLVARSTLERDQAKAVVGALCSPVACIQGLPGSGKSYIGNLITQILLRAKVFPILIVCYTNHALDQFLCHLLDSNITKIVRIGGQSKEPRLERFNLSQLDRFYNSREMAIQFGKLGDAAKDLERAHSALKGGRVSWNRLRLYLEEEEPDYHADLLTMHYELFEDNWQVMGSDNVLEYWLQGNDLQDTGESIVSAIHDLGRGNLWSWSVRQRQQMHARWQDAVASELEVDLEDAQKQYDSILSTINGIRDQADVEVLRHAEVIGLTTTGVAKLRHKIAAVGPKVVMCEEAGEVLEAQLMACLTPSCQQLIQIGDHQQLRPHIANYDLSVESRKGKHFRLDVSMFERLVSNDGGTGMPWWTLTQQHRMRPQISQYIRRLFYPGLRDAEETKAYPSVKGVSKNVFFINHLNPEDGAVSEQKQLAATSLRSHSNKFEVAYILALLRYLLQQGYRSSDIAIITPYVSQLMALREALRNEFIIELSDLDQAEIEQELGEEAVLDEWSTSPAMLGVTERPLSQAIHLATVDNFQGEEANIILVSMVRSTLQNEENETRQTIGFLKVPNRINVLMSRAKFGLYLVGHGALLQQKSPLWNTILKMMIEEECFGNGLPIHCQKHPDDHRVVNNPSDFKTLAPNGGCLRPCGLRLPKCGHICRLLCHVDRVSHTSIKCMQPCSRLHDVCGHPCPKYCGEECGKCEVVMGTITLPCGHQYENAKCWEASDPSKIFCMEIVERVVESCGHSVPTACSSTNPKCSRVCGGVLSCGHSCQRECSVCVTRTVETLLQHGIATVEYPITPLEHGACSKKCDRMLSCGHRCKGICHLRSECPPCEHKCDIFQCSHGGCEHACHLTCAACCEDCTWNCKHMGRCELPCGAPCTRPICSKRCNTILLCGHQCPSVCGEKCPARTYCHECGEREILEKQVDLILFQSYEEVDVNEDPILVLPCCGAMLAMSSLDGVVGLSRVYDDQGLPLPLPDEMLDLPKCPNCSCAIRGIHRYNRITKIAAIDAAEKKFIQQSHRMMVALQKQLREMETDADAKDGGKFLKKIQQFARSTKNPPCSKVYHACVAKILHCDPKTKVKEEDRRLLPVPNSSFPYQGSVLLFRAQYYLLAGKPTMAHTCARQATSAFEGAHCDIQLRDARLVLAQTFVVNATTLTKSNHETKASVQERANKILDIGKKVDKLLKELPASYQANHATEINAMTQKLDFLRECARTLTFYEDVSTDELRSVRIAMQEEFSGSGHWYRCPNGHMYSVGECGRPMEQARCPECGSTMGGTDHRPAAGNVHAADMDRL